MKILKQVLLLSFLSVLVIFQSFGEESKDSDNSFVQFGGDEIKDMAQFEQEHEISGIIYRDLPDGRKNVPIKAYRKKIKNNSRHDPVKVESRDYLTEIKDGLHKIFDLCLIIGGIALIFLMLKILYSLSKYIDSLIIRYAGKKAANSRPIEETKS